MKVILLCKYPVNAKRGGVAMHRDKLIHYISNSDTIDLHIVTLGNKQVEFKNDNLTVHMIKKRKIFYIPLLTPILLLIIKHKIQKINPDIVHVLGGTIPYSLAAKIVQKDIPTVLTMYGIATEEVKMYSHYNALTAFLSIINEKFVCYKISDIIVSTQSIKNLISKNSNSRIHIVPYGIELNRIENIKPYDLNVEPDIFFVGRLVKGKGVDTLIKAISLVVKSFPNLTVCIAGYGEQENELKNLTKELNLGRNVNFLGFISEKKKFQYFKASKIVVIPSQWDVAPISIYEAMASGRAICASNVGGIPDLLDNGKIGLLFEPGNVEDLANKITKLLKDERLRKKMEKASKEKARNYEWSDIAKRSVEVYEEIISIHNKK